jgi:PTH1 family peptidyl-tRNA hydrolase
VGFQVLDELVSRWGVTGVAWSEKFGAQFLKCRVKGDQVILLAPMEYMNTSGISASKVLKFFKISPSDSIVIYDELDLPPGIVRLKRSGGTGGHRGLESLCQHFGTREFQRVRVGIGHPRDISPNAGEHNVSAWVLGKPGSQDRELIKEGILQASDAVEFIVQDGFKEAQKRVHSPKIAG